MGNDGNNDGSGKKTIDDLIAEYKSLIARRQEWIDFLKNKKKKQENQLTSLGFSSISLDEIDSSVEEIMVQLDEATKIRDKLKKEDKLDPELDTAIEQMLKQSAKLREKLDKLIAANNEAKAAKKAAKEKAAKEKAAKAAK